VIRQRSKSKPQGPALKKLTIRLPDEVATEIEAEAHERKVSRSHILRERLTSAYAQARQWASVESIRDLIGSVDDALLANLSLRKKEYLRMAG